MDGGGDGAVRVLHARPRYVVNGLSVPRADHRGKEGCVRGGAGEEERKGVVHAATLGRESEKVKFKLDNVVGRLAPTPSGALHLGNALAFGAAWLSARAAGGRLLLRMEDLDRGRSRPDVEREQRADLRWLGLDWDAETPRQSGRRYTLDGIDAYRCDCPRAARREGPCACREASRVAGAWRLRTPRREVSWIDRARGVVRAVPTEDPVLVRADGEPGYPLAVVIDDARDGVTEVVRGADLVDATASQVILHGMLGLSVPTYLHVPLVLGPDGRKLGKSHGSTGIAALRHAGWRPEDVWATLLPQLGIDGAVRLDEAVVGFDATGIPPGPVRVDADGRVTG